MADQSHSLPTPRSYDPGPVCGSDHSALLVDTPPNFLWNLSYESCGIRPLLPSLLCIWSHSPHKDVTHKLLSQWIAPSRVSQSLCTFEEFLYWSSTLPHHDYLALHGQDRLSPEQSIHNILQQTIHTGSAWNLYNNTFQNNQTFNRIIKKHEFPPNPQLSIAT